MDDRVSRLRSAKEALILAENARRLGHSDIEAQARARALTLKAEEEGFTTPAAREIAVALYAYEDAQERALGRTFRATRTRQMFKRHGVLLAAERMVMATKKSIGYEALADAGLVSLTFEAIILKFPEEFSLEAVSAAKNRLGIPADEVSHSGGSLIVEQDLPPEPSLAAEVIRYLSIFLAGDTWFIDRWKPAYESTIREIAQSMSEDRIDHAATIIWRQQDNHISHAGKGVLSYDMVDANWDDLLKITRQIYNDPSAECFDSVINQFETWKSQGRIDKVPRVMTARAFAALHPSLYHTTVDAGSQDEVIAWFAEHSGLRVSRATMTGNWAKKAVALTRHIDALCGFGDDHLSRNIFPWFVIQQIRSGGDNVRSFSLGHVPRPHSAFASLPEERRMITLRHNQLQTALYGLLCTTYGVACVGTELPTGTGGFADAVVVREGAVAAVYEIKIAATASDAIRQAIGQLLEYSFRHGGLEAEKLVVVAEPTLDPGTEAYIRRLKNEFSLPIEYPSIALKADS